MRSSRLPIQAPSALLVVASASLLTGLAACARRTSTLLVAPTLAAPGVTQPLSPGGKPENTVPLPPPTDAQDHSSGHGGVMAVMSTDRWDQVILRAAAELRERGWGAAQRWSHGGIVIAVLPKDYEQVREHLEARAEYAKYMVPRSHPFPWDWVNSPR